MASSGSRASHPRKRPARGAAGRPREPVCSGPSTARRRPLCEERSCDSVSRFFLTCATAPKGTYASRFSPRFVALSLASLALTLAPPPAQACGGGMFVPETQTQTTSMSGHRVAISISTEQTVLWDQIKYQGNPKDFAWVMPVKAGATIGVGSDAWLEALDAATTTHLSSPRPSAISAGARSRAAAGAAARPRPSTEPATARATSPAGRRRSRSSTARPWAPSTRSRSPRRRRARSATGSTSTATSSPPT